MPSLQAAAATASQSVDSASCAQECSNGQKRVFRGAARVVHLLLSAFRRRRREITTRGPLDEWSFTNASFLSPVIRLLFTQSLRERAPHSSNWSSPIATMHTKQQQQYRALSILCRVRIYLSDWRQAKHISPSKGPCKYAQCQRLIYTVKRRRLFFSLSAP